MAIRIPRFQHSAQLTDQRGNPTQTFHIWWDRVAQNLEEAFNELEGIVSDLSDIVADIQAAQATADQAITDAASAAADALAAANAAQDAADDALQALADAAAADAAAAAANAAAAAAAVDAATAQATAEEAKVNDKISASSTVPTAILSASDAGATARITVANHTRKYGDATSLSVTGGNITGLAFSTTYAVYYDDTTTSNTTPTYIATILLANAQFAAAEGRHYCGQITTPADGGGLTSGDGPRGPGGGGPYP